jgi:hypothetical protein
MFTTNAVVWQNSTDNVASDTGLQQALNSR